MILVKHSLRDNDSFTLSVCLKGRKYHMVVEKILPVKISINVLVQASYRNTGDGWWCANHQ